MTTKNKDHSFQEYKLQNEFWSSIAVLSFNLSEFQLFNEFYRTDKVDRLRNLTSTKTLIHCVMHGFIEDLSHEIHKGLLRRCEKYCFGRKKVYGII